ncbi:MAG TPA: DUF4062 domain-containing protein, partial [Thermoanaerobaculia bacterium]|nr:DUF4062 domain-containing protein [Thermoanaerobaculia bacterium]
MSSTYEDLIEERRALMENLITNDYIPAGMESFPAAPNPPWTLIERMMDSTDYYVLVIGKSYGSIDAETGISFTHREYREAKRRGNMPILAFLIESNSGPAVEDSLAAFRREVQSDEKTFKKWSDKADLANKVIHALNDARQSTPRDGWIRQRDALVSRDIRAIRADMTDAHQHIDSIDSALQQTRDHLKAVSSRLDEAIKASEAIHSYKTMLRNKELLDPIYRHAADKLMETPFEIVRGLAEARLYVRGEWIGTVFDVLASGVTERYDGVSSDDLKWWLDDKNSAAVRYLTRNKQLV